MIREMEVGYLHFGAHPCEALRVVYAQDEESEQAIYLSSDDASALGRIWDDLHLDAPGHVVVPASHQP
jgi:hypothetical protein